MKLLSTLFCCLFFSTLVFCQDNKIDYIRQLNREKGPEKVVEYINSNLATLIAQESPSESVMIYLLLWSAQIALDQSIESNETVNRAWTLAPELKLDDSISSNTIYHLAVTASQTAQYTSTYDIGIERVQYVQGRLSNNPFITKEEEAELHIQSANLHFNMSKFDQGFNQLAQIDSMLPSLPPDLKKQIEFRLLSSRRLGFSASQQITKTLDITKRLIEIAKEQKDTIELSACYESLGIGYFRIGDYTQSEYYLSKRLETLLTRYSDDAPPVIQIYNNLGVINMKLERYDVAMKYYNKNKVLIKKNFGEDHPRMGQLHFNLGVNHFQKEEYDGALKEFQRSLFIRQKHLGLDHQDVAHCKQLISQCYATQKNYNDAIAYATDALATWLKLTNKYNAEVARLYSALASMHANSRRYDVTLNMLDSAFSSLRYDPKSPLDFGPIENPTLLMSPLNMAIEANTALYEINQNSEHYEQALLYAHISDSLLQYFNYHFDDQTTRLANLAERSTYHAALIDLYYERFIQTQDQSFFPELYEAFEKQNNAFLYEIIAEKDGATKYDLPISLLGDKKTLQDSIAFLENQMEELSVDESRELFKSKLTTINLTKKALSDLLAKIKTDYPEYYNNIYNYQILPYQQLLASLTEDEVILTFLYGHSYPLCFKIEKNNCDFVKLPKRDTLEPLILSFLETIKQHQAQDKLTKEAKELYSELITPLGLEKGQKITIIGDDILTLIPFELLINPGSGKRLNDEHAIYYQYSCSILNQALSPTKTFKNTVLAMAPMTGDASQDLITSNISPTDIFRDNLGLLPESENEIEYISTHYPTTTLKGIHATESEFKNIAQDAQVIHLATHGFVNHQNVNKSRLYFHADNDSTSDGILNSYEIINLPLSADLVVLSACNTGVGRIQNSEGVASLGRAFGYAGCPNQLMSLWPVNDLSTTTIMSHFYDNLKAGLGKADALIQAKEQYLTEVPPQFQHPYYWAGFVYYGANTPLDISTGGHSTIYILMAVGLLTLLFIFFRSRKK